MARVTVTPTDTDASGIVMPTAVAFTADGISVPTNCLVLIENTSGGASAITVQTPETRDGNAVAEDGASVANNTERVFGPFSPVTHGRPTSGSDAGQVWIDSAVTTGCVYRVISS